MTTGFPTMTGISGLGLDSPFVARKQPTLARKPNKSKVIQQLSRDCKFENLLTKTSLDFGNKRASMPS